MMRDQLRELLGWIAVALTVAALTVGPSVLVVWVVAHFIAKWW